MFKATLHCERSQPVGARRVMSRNSWNYRAVALPRPVIGGLVGVIVVDEPELAPSVESVDRSVERYEMRIANHSACFNSRGWFEWVQRSSTQCTITLRAAVVVR